MDLLQTCAVVPPGKHDIISACCLIVWHVVLPCVLDELDAAKSANKQLQEEMENTLDDLHRI